MVGRGNAWNVSVRCQPTRIESQMLSTSFMCAAHLESD
ncbi:hypothetical protein LMG33818_001582 [Halomonadaceae bacterium LMG 33818]